MRSYRTKHAQDIYLAYMKEKAENRPDTCDLCDREALQTFDYWKIMENKFPYDLLATKHHMLLPIRHTDERGLTPEERRGI